MFIYNGKFNWFNYASNETITIVFPAGFALNDPVSAYWQWTVDAKDNKKASVAKSAVVQNVTTASDGSSSFLFSSGYYSFDATVTADFKTLTVEMRDPKDDASGPFVLGATHVNVTSIPSVVVYTGRLEWWIHAKEEMTTLVVPYGVAEGNFFGLYHQWTVNAQGVEKANMAINGVFQDVKIGEDGRITAKFSASYYTYTFTFNGGKEGSFVLSEPQDKKSGDNKFKLAYAL